MLGIQCTQMEARASGSASRLNQESRSQHTGLEERKFLQKTLGKPSEDAEGTGHEGVAPTGPFVKVCGISAGLQVLGILRTRSSGSEEEENEQRGSLVSWLVLCVN